MPNQYVNKVQQSNGTVLIDITDTTAVASDVATGKYFYLATGEKVEGTSSGGGGGPSATQHSIYFEFSDSTNTTITGYWDDSFISDAITATTPTTYGGKTVELAQLDGVSWYDVTSGWELVHEGRYTPMVDYGCYFWIPAMVSIIPTVGSEWRITIDSTSYECTAKQIMEFGDAVNGVIIGNQKYIGRTDDGSDAPFCFYNYNSQAWSGDTSSDVMTVQEHYIKIERKLS